MASTVQRCARLSVHLRPTSSLLKYPSEKLSHCRNTKAFQSLAAIYPSSSSTLPSELVSGPLLPSTNIIAHQPISFISTCSRHYGLFSQAEKKDSTTSSPDDPSDSAAGATSEETAALLKKTEELLEKLEADNKKLVEERDEFKDKYKRSLAETENVRNRMQKQISDAKIFGIQGFCKDLLEVADILEKAVEATPKDNMSSNQELKDLFDGLTMTETQLLKVFGKHGLTRVDPAAGEKFDPNLHEALFQLPVPDKDNNTVAVVTQKGFALNGRTLRAAKVGVVKNA